MTQASLHNPGVEPSCEAEDAGSEEEVIYDSSLRSALSLQSAVYILRPTNAGRARCTRSQVEVVQVEVV